MRIVYGVHGYGRGHATRSMSVISELKDRHELLILAGGDAYEAMRDSLPVVRIPTLGFCYNRHGQLSTWLTFRHNFAMMADLTLSGPSVEMVCETMREFEPDAILTDAEPLVSHAGRQLGIPRISFDHFGIMAYCQPRMSWMDRVLSFRDVYLYRWLMRQPDRVIVSSFYDAPARRDGLQFVGTLLRPEVFEFQPDDGEHLLVYLNKGEHLLTPRIEAALHASDLPVKVYGTGRTHEDGKLQFRPNGNRSFLHDLASCRAVISTAGNQLVGEAIHFGKPMLVMPEDAVEQRINAAGLESLGIGMQVPHRRFDVSHIQAMLDREQDLKARIAEITRDGREEAVASIEAYLAELTDASPTAEPKAATGVA